MSTPCNATEFFAHYKHVLNDMKIYKGGLFRNLVTGTTRFTTILDILITSDRTSGDEKKAFKIGRGLVTLPYPFDNGQSSSSNA